MGRWYIYRREEGTVEEPYMESLVLPTVKLAFFYELAWTRAFEISGTKRTKLLDFGKDEMFGYR